MLSLDFRAKSPLSVLCIGAHSDDIEIGLGGTLLKWRTERDLSVHAVVLSAVGERATEAEASLRALLGDSLSTLDLQTFRETYFPYLPELKDYVQTLGKGLSPDLIFTHYRNDRHQDHRMVSDLTWNAFRNQSVLEYEIPKLDGDLGQPNVFVPLSEKVLTAKLEHLETHFASQQAKPWYDRETFLGLARLRGVECAGQYAEAFYGRKLMLG